MNIVVISTCSPREKLVVHQVINNFSNVTVIQHTYESAQSDGKKSKERFVDYWGKKVLNYLRKTSINKTTKDIVLDPRIYLKIEFDHRRINTDEGFELLQSLNPDILVTCNAPILKSRIIQIPKLAAINVHYGIPRFYRGNNTLFWPWYFKDFDNIGGSIHHINTGVDRGNILAMAFPALEPRDGETQLDLKTSELLGVVLTDVLRFFLEEGKIPLGLLQTDKGRNFKLRERTFWISLKALALQKLGRLNPPRREQRIVHYFSEVAESIGQDTAQ